MADVKKFSADEVALHTTRKDHWLTIHGKDCGGEEMIPEGGVSSELPNPVPASLPGSVPAEADDKGKLALGLISQPHVHQEVDKKLDVVQGSGRFTGVVKQLHVDKGRVYGFITTNNGSGDLFFDGLSIGPPYIYGFRMTEGDMVEFSIREGVDGRMEAFNVSTPGFDFGSGEDSVGVVKSFDIQKLSGFIGSPNFNDDLFFDVNSISSRDLNKITVGDIVLFSVGKGVNGRNEAVDILLGCRFDFYVMEAVDILLDCEVSFNSFRFTLPPSHKTVGIEEMELESYTEPSMLTNPRKKIIPPYKETSNPGIGVRTKSSQPSQPNQPSPSTTEPATTDSSTTRFPARRLCGLLP